MPTPLDEEKIVNANEEATIDKLLDEASIPAPEHDETPPPAPAPEPIEEPAPASESPVEPPPGTPQEPPSKADLRLESETELQSRLDAFTLEKNASPQRVKMASALKDIIKEKQKFAEDALSQLKAEKAEREKLKPLTPETEQELERLRQFQRLYGIEHDPVIAQKYDAPIKSVAQEALGLLTQWGTPASVTKFIGENGGVDSFLTSQDLMPDGKTTRADWFEEEIYKAMTPVQRRAFDARSRRIEDLSAQRDNEISSAKQDAQKFEAGRREEIEKQGKAWEGRLLKAKESFVKQFGADAQKKDIPVTATPEVRAEIERHNKDIEASEALFQSAMKARTPEEIAQVGVLAGYSQYIYPRMLEAVTKLGEQTKRADDLQKQLDAIKKSGRTAKQSNAPAVPSKTINDGKLEKDDGKAMDKLLAEV